MEREGGDARERRKHLKLRGVLRARGSSSWSWGFAGNQNRLHFQVAVEKGDLDVKIEGASRGSDGLDECLPRPVSKPYLVDQIFSVFRVIPF